MRGGGCKHQQVPAPIVAAPTSTICGVGPTIPTTSLLSDNDAPLSSPQVPTITVQPPTEPLQTPSASVQLPPPHIRPFRPTKKVRSSSATDVWTSVVLSKFKFRDKASRVTSRSRN
jgi:hypothetical protein